MRKATAGLDGGKQQAGGARPTLSMAKREMGGKVSEASTSAVLRLMGHAPPLPPVTGRELGAAATDASRERPKP